MAPVEKNAATVRTSFSVSTVKSQPSIADATETTEATKAGADTTKDAACRPKDRLRHPVLRQPQVLNSTKHVCARAGGISSLDDLMVLAKTEAENQQARKTTKAQVDAGFVKELERFLSQWDVAQLRRKELLHKRWTERVWLPLQRRVEAHVSCCGPVEAKRRQSLYSQYISHCNAKGFVFLETYDPAEYNPFPLSDHCKIHERWEEQALPWEAGCKRTKKHKQQSGHPSSSVTPQAKTPLLASSYSASASTKPPAPAKESSRLCAIPYHVLATATAGGRCHNTSCWFSRCGHQQPPPGSQQLQSLPTSK